MQRTCLNVNRANQRMLYFPIMRSFLLVGSRVRLFLFVDATFALDVSGSRLPNNKDR